MLRITRRGSPARLAPAVTGVAALSVAAPYISSVIWILAIGLLGLLALAMIVMVLCPAVWSNKKVRRDAAMKVLDRILWR